MVLCPKCGRQEEDGTKFCGACGTKLELAETGPEVGPEPEAETVYCPNCGAPASADSTYCRECGAALHEEKSGKKAGKAVLFGGVAVAAVLIAAIAVSLFSGGKGGKDYALYLRDNEISYTAFLRKALREVSQRLLNGGTAPYASLGYQLGGLVALRGNTIFYPDRCDVGTYGTLDRISLYYRDIRKADEEGIRIDSDINRGYQVNASGTLLTYTKGSDSVLYQHDLKNRTKIASSVMNYWVTENGKTVAYLDQENNLYRWSGGESEKVASEVQYVYKASDDLSTFYYERDGGLYMQKDSENRTKIASDVNEVQIYDSGEVYYTVLNSRQVRLSDYVNDSLKESDGAMTAPVAPAYPNPLGGGSDATFETILAQYKTELSSYEEAQKAYREKQERDSLRESLESATLDSIVPALYYYDGTESTVITENMADSHCYATDKAVGVIRLYSQSEVPKVELSEIKNVYDVQQKVQNALFATGDYYIIQGANMTPLERESAFGFYINRDGTQIAFQDEMSSDNSYGELFLVTVDKNGAVNAPERYDSDVSSFSILFYEDNTLRYFKEVNSSGDKGELYLNQKQVDYDVYLYGVTYIPESKTVYYFTDWNSERTEGTLKFFNGGSTVKVADDIHAIGFTAKDHLLYLADFSRDSYRGTLYQYDAKEPVKIDDDVAAIIAVYD